MKSNKLLLSTLILVFSGLIAKALGIFVKIVLARTLKEDALNILMLTMPTFTLLVTITQLGFPIAISKLVAQGNKRAKKIVYPALIVSLSINIIMIIFILTTSNYIATHLLKNSDTVYTIKAISLAIPMISISSTIRAYFFGRQIVLPSLFSNIAEQGVRILFVILTVPYFLEQYGTQYASMIAMVSVAVSEVASILVFMLFLPKDIDLSLPKITKTDFYDIFEISIPNTGSRLIGSFTYFLEPIILAFTMHSYASTAVISKVYGNLNGYALPLLLLPSFISLALANILLPMFTKEYAKKNKAKILKIFNITMILTTVMAVGFAILYILYAKPILNFVYQTSAGLEYVNMLLPAFTIYYFQIPLTTMMHSLDMSTKAMYSTAIGGIFKIAILFIFSYYFHLGIYALVISISINILIVTLYDAYFVINKLKGQFN